MHIKITTVDYWIMFFGGQIFYFKPLSSIKLKKLTVFESNQIKKKVREYLFF